MSTSPCVIPVASLIKSLQQTDSGSEVIPRQTLPLGSLLHSLRGEFSQKQYPAMEKYLRPVEPHKDTKDNKVTKADIQDHRETVLKDRKTVSPKSQHKKLHHRNHGHHHCHHQQQPHQSDGSDSHGTQSTAENSSSHRRQPDHHNYHCKQKPHHAADGISHSSASDNSSGSSFGSSSSSSSSSSTTTSSSSSYSSSSSTSTSPSTLSSESSTESLNKHQLRKPQHSQSCTDISRVQKAFEEEDTTPLIDDKGNVDKVSAKEKRLRQMHSHHSSAKGILKNKPRMTRNSGKDGSFRKAKSMEALPSHKERGGMENIDEDELDRRNIETRKNLVKEKLKFSAFLNEITRQVLSPLRLTSLGVTDAHKPNSTGPAIVRSPKVDGRVRRQRSLQRRPSSADSVTSSNCSHTSMHSQLSKHSHTSRLSRAKHIHHHRHHHIRGDSPHCVHHSRRSCTDIRDSPKNHCPQRHRSLSLSSHYRSHSPTYEHHHHHHRGDRHNSKHHRHHTGHDSPDHHRQHRHHHSPKQHHGGHYNSPAHHHGDNHGSSHDHHHCKDQHSLIRCHDIHHRPCHQHGDHQSSGHHQHHSDQAYKTQHHSMTQDSGEDHKNSHHHHHEDHTQSHHHHHGDYHSPTHNHRDHQSSTHHHHNQDHNPTHHHQHDDHHSPTHHQHHHHDNHCPTNHHPHDEHHSPPHHHHHGNHHSPTHQHHHDDHHHPTHHHHYADHSPTHHHHHDNHHSPTHHHHHDNHHNPTHHHHHQDHGHDDHPSPTHHHQHGDHSPAHQHHHDSHHSPTYHHHHDDHHIPTHHQHHRDQSPTHHHHHDHHHSSTPHQEDHHNQPHHHHHGDHHSPTHHHPHGDQHSPTHHHHHDQHHSSTPHQEDHHNQPHHHHHGDHHSPTHQDHHNQPHHHHHGDHHSPTHHHQHEDHHQHDSHHHHHISHSDFHHPATVSDSEHSPIHSESHHGHHSSHQTPEPHHSHSKRNSPVSLSSERKLESHSSRNTTSSSSQDEEQTGYRSSTSSLHKDKKQEMGRVKKLQGQNEDLHHSLFQTAVRMECLGEEFMSSHQLLEAELQGTRLELSGLMEKFKRLQDNYSSTQQTNNLLEQKLHSVAQNMEGDRESLNQRISALTEQLAHAKTAANRGTLNAAPAQRDTLDQRFHSDESVNQFVIAIAPPPAQFMDSHNYGKAKATGQEQSLVSVPEEEESDWSEIGEETPRFFFTGSNRGCQRAAAFSPWRHDHRYWPGQGEGDVDSESGGEEIVRPHLPRSLHIPHLQFTVHRDLVPVPLTSHTSPTGCITAGPKHCSPIRIRSASLEEIPLAHHMQEELRGTAAMMDLHHSEHEVIDDSDNEIIHHWRPKNDSETIRGRLQDTSGSEPAGSLASLQSAQRMLNHFICELQPSDGQGRAEVQGWVGGVPDEVLKGERTKL